MEVIDYENSKVQSEKPGRLREARPEQYSLKVSAVWDRSQKYGSEFAYLNTILSEAGNEIHSIFR